MRVYTHAHGVCSQITGPQRQPACLLVRRWEAEQPPVVFQRLQDNKNKELDRLNGVYMKILDGAGVKYHEGRGTIVDAHTVDVDGKRFTVHP